MSYKALLRYIYSTNYALFHRMNCTTFSAFEKNEKKLFLFTEKSVIIMWIMGRYARSVCSFICLYAAVRRLYTIDVPKGHYYYLF